jgi:succinate-semialdehyde dehydrogenase/glutarate-semialdehyde dehydrogenase
VSDLIEANVDKYAKLITTEMGKPTRESVAEVKKAAAYCRFYADNAEKYLKPKRVKTEATESYVKLDPIGAILFISPFNFPFWLSIHLGHA